MLLCFYFRFSFSFFIIISSRIWNYFWSYNMSVLYNITVIFCCFFFFSKGFGNRVTVYSNLIHVNKQPVWFQFLLMKCIISLVVRTKPFLITSHFSTTLKPVCALSNGIISHIQLIVIFIFVAFNSRKKQKSWNYWKTNSLAHVFSLIYWLCHYQLTYNFFLWTF